MKQILALMTLLLILMLTITTVMAVGNVKQSQQMAQRMQLISSLRADLRSAKQEQETLNTQLECERATSRTLRTERNALNKRYDHLMTLLRSQPVGYTDALPAPISWTSPLIPSLAGESWLQAQALERLLNERQAAQNEAEAALAATDQRLQEALDGAKEAGERSIFSVAGAQATATATPVASQTPATTPVANSATATVAPRDTLSPAMAGTMAQATTASETPVARQTPTDSPAATTSSAADSATATVAPKSTPSPIIAATATVRPSAIPLATATFPPLSVATPAPAQPTATPAASPLPAATPAPREKNLLQSALITGLDTLQHWLQKLEAAIDRAIDQLQPAATHHP